MPKTITIPLELAEKILEGLDMAGNEGFPLDAEEELQKVVDICKASTVQIILSKGIGYATCDNDQINFKLPYLSVSGRKVRRLGFIEALKDAHEHLDPKRHYSEMNSYRHLISVIDNKEIADINKLLDGDTNG